MYPFRRSWRWWTANRQLHLARAIEESPAIMEGHHAEVIHARLKQLQAWMKARLVLFVLLYFSLIARGVTFVLDRTGDPSPAVQDTLSFLTTTTNTLSGAFALGVLLAMRTLGQIEMDLITLASMPVPRQMTEHAGH